MSDADRRVLATLLRAALPGWTWQVRGGAIIAVSGLHPSVRGGKWSIGVEPSRRVQGACGVVAATFGHGWRERLVAGVVAGVAKEGGS